MPEITPKAGLSQRIAQGRGQTPADLVLKGGRVFDLITGELVETDVAICGDTIVGVFGSYHGQREVDVTGKVLVPGFIDTHLHIESSLVTPHEFDRCVLPYGVTTVICDPHEIANVLGTEGIADVGLSGDWVQVETKNHFAVGDLVEVVHPSGNITVRLQEMRNLEGQPVQVAQGSPVRVWIPLPARYSGALLARVIEFAAAPEPALTL